jgi:Tfp pilus assembly protein PilF
VIGIFEDWRRWVKVGLIVAACAGIYWHSGPGGWLMDDDTLLYQNPDIHSPKGLQNIWFNPSTPDYFPLTITALWVQWRLFLGVADGYRLMSLAMHAAGALMLWWALGKMRVPGGWVAGLIFAVHPVCVPSVAWIAEQKNTLSMPLFLAAWGFFAMWVQAGGEAERRRRELYLAALGFFLAAMLAKSSVVMFPVAAVLYLWWRGGGAGRREWWGLVPFFAVSFVLGLVTLYFQQVKAIAGEDVPIGGAVSRVAVAGRALLFYLGNLVAPSNLMAINPRWELETPGLWDFLPWVVIVAAGAVFWVFRKSWGRHALMAFGFYVVMILPVLGFVKIAYMRLTWVSDHFLYVPMLGPVALAGAMVVRWRESARGAAGAAVALAVLGMAAGLAWTARGYAAVWQSEEPMWTHNLARNPEAWQAHSRLGAFYLNQKGDREGFRKHAGEALRLRPDLGELHSNMGSARVNEENAPEASASFRRAADRSPLAQPIRDNLIRVLLVEGRYDEAAAQARIIFEASPNDPVNLHNLATALRMVNQNDAAMRTFRAALRVNPKFAESLKAMDLVNEEEKNGRLPKDEGSVWAPPASAP